MKRFINRMAEWFKNTGNEDIDVEKFKELIFNFTKSFKFNKVVSSFMILLNQAKHKKLTKACKQDIISLLEIYIPNIKSKLTA